MARKQQRRSIRFALVAVVCLLLGAATTVGVAWEIGRPFRVLRRQWAGEHVAKVVGLEWEVRASPLGPAAGVSTLRAGWPFLALQSEHSQLVGLGGASFGKPWTFVSWHAGLQAPESWRFLHECLPIWPLFPGFAVDTALYAMAWYLLIFTPLPLIRAGRRRFRVSRGMCGSCGYDLNGSKGGPCPECGAGSGAAA